MGQVAFLKKVGFFILINILPALTFSQPENLGFEAWTTSPQNTTDPDSAWVSIDPAFVNTNNINPKTETVQQLTSNVGKGLYSARVKVSEDVNQSFNLDGRLVQLVPFTRRPDSFSFMHKANMAGSDYGVILFQLTKYDPNLDSSLIVGSGVEYVFRSTNGWETVSEGYNYQKSIAPDTLIMAIWADYSGNQLTDGTLGTYVDVDAMNPAIGCKVNAGVGDTIKVCKSSSAVKLFPKLKKKPESGGKWFDKNNSGGLNNGRFNPSLAQAGKAYNFEYVVTDRFCESDTATVRIYIPKNPSPSTAKNAGACSNDSVVSLWNFGSPNIIAGGSWNDPFNSGILKDSVIKPYQLKPSQIDSTFKYVLKASNQCGTGRDTLSIKINPAPDAGKDTMVSICGSEDSVKLFNQLSGNPDSGGKWYDKYKTGAIGNGIFDASQVKNKQKDTVEYFKGILGCEADTAELVLDVKPGINPGEDTTVKVCRDNTGFDLNSALSQDAQSGGAWNDMDTSGILSGGVIDPSSLPAAGLDQVYRFGYEVSSKICGTEKAIIHVEINDFSNAGIGDTVDACQSRRDIDLLEKLSGNPDTGGTWYDDDNTGGLQNGEFDGTQVQVGQKYQFRYIRNNGGCEPDTSVLTLSMQDGPQPGLDSQVFICRDRNNVNLSNFLSQDADAGGNWIDLDSSGILNGNAIKPTNLQTNEVAQTYDFAYELSNNICDTLRAVISTTINDFPEAGSDASTEVCQDNNALKLFDELAGNPDTTGKWSSTKAGNAIDSGYFNATALQPGKAYSVFYAVNDEACETDSSELELNVKELPNPGKDTAIKVISNNQSVNLWENMGGNPDSGGNWKDIDGTGALNDQIFNASAVDTGNQYDFRYTATSNVCPDSAALIAVNVEKASGLRSQIRENLNVYPNPAVNKVYVQNSNDLKLQKVTLRTMAGKMVKTSQKEPVNLMNVKPGPYIVTIHLPDEKKVRKQIIKIKQ